MSRCIDKRDQVTQNTLGLSQGPYVNFDGEYTLDQIDAFANELAQDIIANAETNPLSIATNRYGDSFNNSVSYLNGLFRNLINDNLGDYPEIERRWERGNITSLEVAEFIDSYNYTPQGVLDQTDYLKLLRELNGFYVSSISDSKLGGFCGSLKNIFAQIDAFYDLIGVVDGIITDALSFINKIQNFEGFPDEATAATLIPILINKIKDQIEAVIREVFQEVEDAIANFDIEGMIGDFEEGSLATAKAILTTKEQMCTFFTEDNKKTLLDKVRGFIDYAVSLFESPSLEQIRYLVFRFCALATNIELLIRDIKSPLDNYGFRYQRIVKRLQTISNINTSTAIRNGAIRYSPERRQESINRLRSMWNGEDGTNPITPTGEVIEAVKPITLKEYKDLPTCGKVFKSGDKGIFVEGDWIEDLGITGYTRIDLDVKVYLMRLQKALGRNITITRGWYSKDYNDEVGGDPENSHLSGMVIDIKNNFDFDITAGIPLEDLEIISDINDIDGFTEAALKAGFKYIVINDDEIHLDIREIPR